MHGSLGVGRTGCFCAVSVAMDMMELAKESVIDAFDDDSNILDQVDTQCSIDGYCFIYHPNKVIRGLRNHRPGMVGSCDQYEFCYRVLEEALWGEVSKKATASGSSKPPEKKSKFKLFRRKRYPTNNE